ncbi:hypothetical protein M8J77_020554 [Diaphorina citri]|nr:hypothetical protein M8J77_020554 [Diaphorina citri]
MGKTTTPTNNRKNNNNNNNNNTTNKSSNCGSSNEHNITEGIRGVDKVMNLFNFFILFVITVECGFDPFCAHNKEHSTRHVALGSLEVKDTIRLWFHRMTGCDQISSLSKNQHKVHSSIQRILRVMNHLHRDVVCHLVLPNEMVWLGKTGSRPVSCCGTINRDQSSQTLTKLAGGYKGFIMLQRKSTGLHDG